MSKNIQSRMKMAKNTVILSNWKIEMLKEPYYGDERKFTCTVEFYFIDIIWIIVTIEVTTSEQQILYCIHWLNSRDKQENYNEPMGYIEIQ